MKKEALEKMTRESLEAQILALQEALSDKEKKIESLEAEVVDLRAQLARRRRKGQRKLCRR